MARAQEIIREEDEGVRDALKTRGLLRVVPAAGQLLAEPGQLLFGNQPPLSFFFLKNPGYLRDTTASVTGGGG